jgi:DNA processing protein
VSLPGVLDPRDPRPSVQRALRAWLSLQAVAALKPESTVALLERRPDPGWALRELIRGGAAARLEGPDAAVAALARAEAVAIPMTAPCYPARLAAFPDRAPLLMVRGHVGALAGRAVAVVGARAASAYGRGVARALGADLARAGLVVVSGLAHGIDAEAHLGALEAGGLTVAFQGCGPERIYPARHRPLADRIRGQGALVTEFPPGFPPLAHHFPLRNRLIAGLAECVVVVEARERSGSLSTALRVQYGSGDLFALPGPITSPTSVGTNHLLRDGAHVFLHVDDVLQKLGLPASAGPTPPDPGFRQDRGVSTLGRRVLRALHESPASPDELARRLERGPQELASPLLELELAGRLSRDRDGRLRPAPRAPRGGRKPP